MSKKVLIIEDDLALCKGLEIFLRDESFRVTAAHNGDTGYNLALKNQYDIILLDIMLPHKNGINICQDLRKAEIGSPIIMITSRGEELDKIKGFQAGADDYLTKPFGLGELKARIQALIRRTDMIKSSSIQRPDAVDPYEETRVFMFLDINSATTIAEELGHIRYHNLLNDFFSDITDAIETYHGEIYQYVGDEITITWLLPDGVQNANCIKIYFAIQNVIKGRERKYLRLYGVIPTFKAGIHFGLVTVGEVGIKHKALVYSGDVLNVASRIQGLCHQFHSSLLITEELSAMIPADPGFSVNNLGQVMLKGKKEINKICSVMAN